MLYETTRLRVRRLTEADAPAMLAVYGDPEAMRFVDDGQPIPAEDVPRWIEVTLNNYDTRGYGMSAIEHRGEVVGFIGLVHPGGQVDPEVKYALSRHVWGRGLATEAVRGMLAYGRSLGLSRIIATVDVQNHPSVRVLEKCGLTWESEARDDDGSVVATYVSA